MNATVHMSNCAAVNEETNLMFLNYIFSLQKTSELRENTVDDQSTQSKVNLLNDITMHPIYIESMGFKFHSN